MGLPGPDAISRSAHLYIKRPVPTLLPVFHNRPIDGLQKQPPFVRKDRRNDIHQLRKISDLDAIRMPKKSIEEHAFRQSILKVVALLQPRARNLMLGRSLPRTTPGIPLIKSNVDRTLHTLRILRCLDLPFNNLQAILQILRTRAQILLQVTVRIPNVGVQRNIILDPAVDRHERPFFRGRIEEKLTEILKDSAQHGTPSGF